MGVPQVRIARQQKQRHPRTWDAGSVCDVGADSEDVPAGGPTVDPATIVSDLKAIAGHDFHKVEILHTIDLAKDDVPDSRSLVLQRRESDKLAALNLPTHAIAPWFELDRLTLQ
jgi:hypothetical protein